MSFLAKFAASKYVGDKLEENFGVQNPKYDIHILPSGRRKKTKRPLPPGLSARDARVLQALRRKAHRYEWLVDCHCCCLCGLHLQFGTATLWGLVPLVGDVVSLLQALSLVRAAVRGVDGGLPAHLTLVLLAWAAADFLAKLVPIVGDVVAAVVKPNTRNLAHVEAFLRARGERRLRDAGLLLPPPPGAGADGGDDEPLLVSAQPRAQGGMVAGGAAAGPSYGTVRAASAAADDDGDDGAWSGRAAGGGRGTGSSRHLLPFWRDEEDTDSEEEAAGVPGPALAFKRSSANSRA